MAAARIREMFEKGTRAFNTHDIEAMGELLHDDCEVNSPGFEVQGQQAVKAFYRGWIDAFPDARVEVDRVTCTDDQAIEEGVFTGTHRGTLRGPGGDIPATGRRVRVAYIQIARYRGEKVAAFHLMFDRLEMLEQLGLTRSESEAPRQAADTGQGAGLAH
ncbi:MAG: ester cyclase [Anaeromyxobacter sp.]